MNIYFPPSLSVVIIPFVGVSQKRGSTWTSAAAGYCCCCCCCHGERKIPHPHESAARIMHASGGTSCDAAYISSPSKKRQIQSWLYYTRYAGYLCNNRIIRSLHLTKTTAIFEGMHCIRFSFFLT